MEWNAELYNNKHNFVFEYGKGLIDLLDPKKHEYILDLGCGSGQLTYEIAQRARSVVGIDSSPKMISDAIVRFPSIEFKVADASTYLSVKPFDSIFSNAALHWMTDYIAVIKCMYKNLKPNGKLAIEFGGKGNVQAILTQLKNSLSDRGYSTQQVDELWYFPTIGEYSTELENHGFRVLFAENYDRPTKLAYSKNGIVDWLSMFGDAFFEGIDSEEIARIKKRKSSQN